MIKKIMSSELGKGTIVLFVMINFYNLLNFLFHFSAGRILGPADYGVLAVLMSIVYIFSIPTEAIQNLVTKYTSNLKVKKEQGKIKFLLEKSLEKSTKIAIFLFLLAAIIAIFLSKFLEINYWLIFLTNILIFSSFYMPVTRGVLQGRKKFVALGGSMVIEAGLKLTFSISLMVIGMRVFGAIGGVLLGMVAGFVFSLYFNKDILKKEKEKTSFKGIYSTSKPYFISMLMIFVVFSIDIIFAKRFFSAEQAGQYAVLSMLGKMIFFGTAAINKAMFPLTSEKSEKSENCSGIFKKALFIISTICIVVVLIYFFIPETIIKILYGEAYISVAPFLVYSGIALSFLALSNLILVYGLSVNRLKKSEYLLIFIVIEIVLFTIFHNTILEYILALMVSNITIFIGSIILTSYNGKDKHNNPCIQ